jgi:transcriptional repressor NrdR
MKCPYCQFHDSRVVDSRDADDSVRRRRKCLQCGSRFTTYERIDSFPIEIVKRDGRREPFDRQKVGAGLRKACDKRPVSRDQIEAVVDAVESAITRAGRSEIPSAELGEAIMGRLRELDEVAYIRFASVYRRFQDAANFREEVDRLDRGRNQQPPANQLSLFAEPDPEPPPEPAPLTPLNPGASIRRRARQ